MPVEQGGLEAGLVGDKHLLLIGQGRVSTGAEVAAQQGRVETAGLYPPVYARPQQQVIVGAPVQLRLARPEVFGGVVGVPDDGRVITFEERPLVEGVVAEGLEKADTEFEILLLPNPPGTQGEGEVLGEIVIELSVDIVGRGVKLGVGADIDGESNTRGRNAVYRSLQAIVRFIVDIQDVDAGHPAGVVRLAIDP